MSSAGGAGEGGRGGAAAMDSSELAALLDAARARLDKDDADGALGFALAAVKISNGGDLNAIGQALNRVRYACPVLSATHACHSARPPLGHSVDVDRSESVPRTSSSAAAAA